MSEFGNAGGRKMKTPSRAMLRPRGRFKCLPRYPMRHAWAAGFRHPVHSLPPAGECQLLLPDPQATTSGATKIKRQFAYDLTSLSSPNFAPLEVPIRGTATPQALTALGTGLSGTGYAVVVLSDDLGERQGGCQ